MLLDKSENESVMSSTLLVVGGSKGLGRYLLEELGEFPERIGVSRGLPESKPNFQHIQSSAEDFHRHLSMLNETPISLFVYAASAWGESSKVESTEYKDFMQSGPQGLLSSFNALKDSSLLAENALIVSIGSTASEEALSISSRSSYPIYSIAKLTQKALVVQLARTNPEYRFATITVGSIGEEKGHVSSKIFRSP